MPRQHVASVTDCIASIAHSNGLLPDFIWDHPDNKELRELRGNPNVLFEGDVVVIPDKRIEELDRATEQRHRFVRLGVPAHIELQVMRRERPVANTKYTLTIGDRTKDGSTDGDGRVKVPIRPDVITGELVVHTEPEPLVYSLLLGALNPIEELSGCQQRLTNLGYPVPEEETGVLGDATRDAVARFQRDHDLRVTGEPDDETRCALQRLAGQ